MRQPTHLPFKDGRGGIELGLKPIQEQDWLEIDGFFKNELELKRTLLRERKDEVLVIKKESIDAQKELLYMLIGFLKKYHPSSYEFRKNSITIKENEQTLVFDDFDNPIELASLLVQEDLVIMQLQNNEFCLNAACVCAPTRWSLINKFQQSLTEIHSEVPKYREVLDDRVKKVFKNLPNDRIFSRLNWGIVDSPDLFQPVNSKSAVEIENTDPDKLFIRSERQTIRRLSKNESVIFTIRVHVDSIFSILNNLKLRQDLIHAIENLDDDMKEYKVIKPFEKKLIHWLRTTHD